MRYINVSNIFNAATNEGLLFIDIQLQNDWSRLYCECLMICCLRINFFCIVTSKTNLITISLEIIV